MRFVKISLVIIIILLGAILTMGIKHEDTKASGDRGYATEWNKDHIIDGDVECEQYQHKEHVIENRTSFPLGPVAGQIIFRTDTNKLYIFDGTAWRERKLGTNYWSCAGVNFIPENPPDYDYYYDFEQGELIITTVSGEEVVMAPVFLPHGAVVTAAKVFGSNSAKQWDLIRNRLDSAGVPGIMATANINIEDTTISDATIDNVLYHYFIEAVVANGNKIYGARITYTL